MQSSKSRKIESIKSRKAKCIKNKVKNKNGLKGGNNSDKKLSIK